MSATDPCESCRYLDDQALILRAERDEAIAEGDRLRGLLAESGEYVEHASWRCAHPPHYYLANGPPDDGDCACGFDSFWRRVRGALKEASGPGS